MANTQPTAAPTLAEIATAQEIRSLFAFDRGDVERNLARLQRLYAAKKAQIETFYYFFEEGQPDIVLRSAGQELTLRLPAACPQVSEVYAGLRDALSDELQGLERQIVAAHQDVARDHDEARRYGRTADGEPDYVPAILALCVPDVSTADALSHPLAA